MKARRLATLLPLVLLAGPAAAQCDSTVLLPSNTLGYQHFGHSLTAFSDTVMVGVSIDDEYTIADGRVYVHERSSTGWHETQVLFPHDATGAGYDLFGFAVALHRDTALITRPGSGYFLFERKSSGWVETAELALAPSAGSNWLGSSASIDGVTAVLGDWADHSASGSARVFEKSGAGWTQSSQLTPSSCTSHCWFGEDVAVHGDTILVGAGGIYSPDPGAAYFFQRNPAGWVETQKVTAVDGVAGDWFGGSVALGRDVAVVGARFAAGGGAAYVFLRTSTGWVEDAKLTTTSGPEFGRGVSVDWTPDAGYRVLVSGREIAHLYRQGSTDWERIAVYQGSSSFLGPAALSGDTSVIGAPGGDLDGGTGEAFLFELPTFADPYCFCSAGPCSNDDPHAGCMNSTGAGASLEGCGSASVAADDLTLTLSGMTTDQFGLLYMGGGQMHAPFGDGLRCINAGGVGLFRYPVQSSGTSGGFILGPGVVALSHSIFGSAGHLAAGQSWNFQGWFRDPGGPCGSDFNTSNALKVTFAP